MMFLCVLCVVLNLHIGASMPDRNNGRGLFYGQPPKYNLNTNHRTQLDQDILNDGSSSLKGKILKVLEESPPLKRKSKDPFLRPADETLGLQGLYPKFIKSRILSNLNSGEVFENEDQPSKQKLKSNSEGLKPAQNVNNRNVYREPPETLILPSFYDNGKFFNWIENHQKIVEPSNDEMKLELQGVSLDYLKSLNLSPVRKIKQLPSKSFDIGKSEDLKYLNSNFNDEKQHLFKNKATAQNPSAEILYKMKRALPYRISKQPLSNSPQDKNNLQYISDNAKILEILDTPIKQPKRFTIIHHDGRVEHTDDLGKDKTRYPSYITVKSTDLKKYAKEINQSGFSSKNAKAQQNLNASNKRYTIIRHDGRVEHTDNLEDAAELSRHYITVKSTDLRKYANENNGLLPISLVKLLTNEKGSVPNAVKENTFGLNKLHVNGEKKQLPNSVVNINNMDKTALNTSIVQTDIPKKFTIENLTDILPTKTPEDNGEISKLGIPVKNGTTDSVNFQQIQQTPVYDIFSSINKTNNNKKQNETVTDFSAEIRNLSESLPMKNLTNGLSSQLHTPNVDADFSKLRKSVENSTTVQLDSSPTQSASLQNVSGNNDVNNNSEKVLNISSIALQNNLPENLLEQELTDVFPTHILELQNNTEVSTLNRSLENSTFSLILPPTQVIPLTPTGNKNTSLSTIVEKENIEIKSTPSSELSTPDAVKQNTSGLNKLDVNNKKEQLSKQLPSSVVNGNNMNKTALNTSIVQIDIPKKFTMEDLTDISPTETLIPEDKGEISKLEISVKNGTPDSVNLSQTQQTPVYDIFSNSNKTNNNINDTVTDISAGIRNLSESLPMKNLTDTLSSQLHTPYVNADFSKLSKSVENSTNTPTQPASSQVSGNNDVNNKNEKVLNITIALQNKLPDKLLEQDLTDVFPTHTLELQNNTEVSTLNKSLENSTFSLILPPAQAIPLTANSTKNTSINLVVENKNIVQNKTKNFDSEIPFADYDNPTTHKASTPLPSTENINRTGFWFETDENFWNMLDTSQNVFYFFLPSATPKADKETKTIIYPNGTTVEEVIEIIKDEDGFPKVTKTTKIWTKNTAIKATT